MHGGGPAFTLQGKSKGISAAPIPLPKTACSARGGVLYTQLARFAALAVQGGA
jgi:hypothetical protein